MSEAATAPTTDGPAARDCTWFAFIDESGDFEQREDNVLCSALALTGAHPHHDPDRIRATLMTAASEWSWPLHAAELRSPVLYAMVPHVRGVPDRLLRGADILSGTALVAELASAFPDDTASVIAALRAERKPPRAALLVLDAWVRDHHPTTYKALYARRGELRNRLRGILQELSSGAAGDEPAALVIVAGEARPGAAMELPGGESLNGSGRYDALMRVLIERLWCALVPDAPTGKLRIKVLTRHRAVGAGRQPVFVDRRHVEALMVEAVPAASRAALGLDGVYAYDEHVDTRLVLVDFIANQVRCTLKFASRGLPLWKVEKQIRASTGVSVRLRDRTLLAFSGAANGDEESPCRWITEAQREWAPE